MLFCSEIGLELWTQMLISSFFDYSCNIQHSHPYNKVVITIPLYIIYLILKSISPLHHIFSTFRIAPRYLKCFTFLIYLPNIVIMCGLEYAPFTSIILFNGWFPYSTRIYELDFVIQFQNQLIYLYHERLSNYYFSASYIYSRWMNF